MVCLFCKKNQKSEMMKFLGENVYAHLDCALINTQTILESFQSQQMTVKKNLENDPGTCNLCNKDQINIVNCLFCNFSSHYKCFIKSMEKKIEKNEENEIYLITKWLDKCEKQNILLNYICQKKNSPLKQLLKIEVPKKRKQIAIC